jgi:hypothetical protein
VAFFLFISCVYSQGNNTCFTAGCCAHDFQAFLDSITDPNRATAQCTAGQWVYTGVLSLDNVYWDIKTDTVNIIGDLKTTPNTKIHFDINPGSTPSALISTSLIWSPIGTYTFSLVGTAPPGTYDVTLVQFQSREGAGFPSASAPQMPPYPYSLCRVYENDPKLTIETNTRLVLHMQIKNHPTFDCEKGRGDRSFAIGLMIILSIHAVLFLIFCLVTCKRADLKQKIWDID